ncbi:hypothetical protein [Bacteroides heparinolyticus]
MMKSRKKQGYEAPQMQTYQLEVRQHILTNPSKVTIDDFGDGGEL